MARADEATSAWDPLSVGTSARLEAMRLGVAGVRGVDGLFYNPSCLAGLDGSEARVGLVEWYADTRSISSAFAGSTTHGAWGIGAVLFDEGEVRDLDIETGQFTDTYDNNDVCLIAGYGTSMPFARAVRLGLAGRYTQRNIQGRSANSFGLTLGADVALFNGHVSAGVAAHNYGARESFGDGTAEADVAHPVVVGLLVTAPAKWLAPLSFQLGAQSRIQSGRDPDLSYGGEAVYNGILALRIGYDQDDHAMRGISYGVGVCYAGMALDYATSTHDDLGTTHTLSLAYRFGSSDPPHHGSDPARQPERDTSRLEPNDKDWDAEVEGQVPWWWGNEDTDDGSDSREVDEPEVPEHEPAETAPEEPEPDDPPWWWGD